MIRRFYKSVILGGLTGGTVLLCGTAYHNLVHGYIEAKKATFATNSNIDIEYQELPAIYENKVKDILKLGHPVRSADVTVYKNHTLCYDQQRRIPLWVLELLVKSDLQGTGNREKSTFQSDPNIEKMFSSQNEDYSKSGWSRGHMSAAGNHKFDQKAMNDTFYLTNILPQNIDNNAGFWNRIEIHCRELLNKYERVWVVSGPLFMPIMEGDKKFIKYEVIGKSEVAVPTHLYKVVIAEENNNKKYMACFVVPNKPVSRDRTLKEHQVPLEFIESKSGLAFFPKLDRKSLGDLCKVGGCQLKSWQEFELYFSTRKLESARNLNRLEKVWKEIAEKGLKPDAEATKVYLRKKEELEKLGAFGDKDVAARVEQSKKG